jgi:hypothetical protein
MKVHLLMGAYRYDGEEIIAIFSTPEKREEYYDKLEVKKGRTLGFDGINRIEIEIDPNPID